MLSIHLFTYFTCFPIARGGGVRGGRPPQAGHEGDLGLERSADPPLHTLSEVPRSYQWRGKSFFVSFFYRSYLYLTSYLLIRNFYLSIRPECVSLPGV